MSVKIHLSTFRGIGGEIRWRWTCGCGKSGVRAYESQAQHEGYVHEHGCDSVRRLCDTCGHLVLSKATRHEDCFPATPAQIEAALADLRQWVNA